MANPTRLWLKQIDFLTWMLFSQNDCHMLVAFIKGICSMATTRWYGGYHTLVSLLPRAGTATTTCWYGCYHTLVRRQQYADTM